MPVVLRHHRSVSELGPSAGAPRVGMRWRRLIKDSCAAGATRFYEWDGDASHSRRCRPDPSELSIFRDCFTAPVWKQVLVLVAGAVLAPGKRTVSKVLRVVGLAARPGFRATTKC